MDAPQAGHRCGRGHGHGPCDPEGVLLQGRWQGPERYFDDYARRYTDLPLLVVLKEKTLPDGRKAMVPDRYVRASDFPNKLDQSNNPDWKTVAL